MRYYVNTIGFGFLKHSVQSVTLNSIQIARQTKKLNFLHPVNLLGSEEIMVADKN